MSCGNPASMGQHDDAAIFHSNSTQGQLFPNEENMFKGKYCRGKLQLTETCQIEEKKNFSFKISANNKIGK